MEIKLAPTKGIIRYAQKLITLEEAKIITNGDLYYPLDIPKNTLGLLDFKNDTYYFKIAELNGQILTKEG